MSLHKHCLFGTVIVFSAICFALPHKGHLQPLNKPATLEICWYDINNINDHFGNDGEIVTYNYNGDAGMHYPAGSEKTVGFQSGIWFVGKVDGDIRTAVAEYASEFRPGPVSYDPNPVNTQPGTPLDYKNPLFQIYSITKGDNADPSAEHYNWEYANWPVEYGAPAHDGEYFTDSNHNGTWDSGEAFEDYNLNKTWDAPDGVITKGDDPPLWLGDQVHWCVYNDFDSAQHKRVFNTAPLGLEVQQTIFGFSQDGPLDNIMFVKLLVINKSGQTIDSLYIAHWNDDDIGDATDDLVACDTLLDLSYTYNGRIEDSDYGLEVPVKASCMLQGPIIPDDNEFALISGKIIPGYRNLHITNFPKIQKSSSQWPDPETAFEVFNLVRSLETNMGTPLIDPNTNKITNFAFPGDPVTQSGWLDIWPADRRMLMSSGPIALDTWVDNDNDGLPEPGEPGVQEIVFAVIVGQGTSNLKSISVMRHFAGYAHTFWRNNMQAVSVAAPLLTASELDREIVLRWDKNAENLPSTDFVDYRFGGYTIYQGASINGPWTEITKMKSSELSDNIQYAKYNSDSKILEQHVQSLSHAGPIMYQLSVTRDSLQQTDLVNNKRYYFAISAFAWSPENKPAYVESDKTVISVRPHTPALGYEYLYTSRETLPVTFLPDTTDAYPNVTVTDPALFQGDTYAIRFKEEIKSFKVPNYTNVYETSTGYWYLGHIDITQANNPMTDTLINHIYDVGSPKEYQTERGFSVQMPDFRVNKIYKRISEYEQTSFGVPILTDTIDYRAVSPGGVDSLVISGGDTLHLSDIVTSTLWLREAGWDCITIEGNEYFRLYFRNRNPISITPAHHLGRLTDLSSDIFGTGGDSLTNEMYQSDIELRFTENGQKAIRWEKSGLTPVMSEVPFEVWDIEHNQQLCVGYWDLDSTFSIDYDTESHSIGGDWLVIIFRDYAAYQDELFPMENNPYGGWLFIFDSRTNCYTGDVLRLHFLNPIDPETDEFRFTTPARQVVANKKTLKNQLKQITVFPNPYFGYNAEGSPAGRHFVTFSHLPEENVTIRIYSLGGFLVRKIEHDNGTPFETWDLCNEQNKAVASGMYIAHIDVADVGDKILKIAVMTPK